MTENQRASHFEGSPPMGVELGKALPFPVYDGEEVGDQQQNDGKEQEFDVALGWNGADLLEIKQGMENRLALRRGILLSLADKAPYLDDQHPEDRQQNQIDGAYRKKQRPLLHGKTLGSNPRASIRPPKQCRSAVNFLSINAAGVGFAQQAKAKISFAKRSGLH
jgi:hypothetical protein